ncbi:hypothetical protein GEV33_010908 [Tenebrio molitor]|uniref:Uncharacterized protein n=1 Tax=Tenebrio molitor TaxID=7067 RepID=A0A8J6LA65_TENMO|nr:hypothetical protein GEV33_010908 [Tenebrio molitor]
MGIEFPESMRTHPLAHNRQTRFSRNKKKQYASPNEFVTSSVTSADVKKKGWSRELRIKQYPIKFTVTSHHLSALHRGGHAARTPTPAAGTRRLTHRTEEGPIGNPAGEIRKNRSISLQVGNLQNSCVLDCLDRKGPSCDSSPGGSLWVRKYSRQSLVEEKPFGSLVGTRLEKILQAHWLQQRQSHCMPSQDTPGKILLLENSSSTLGGSLCVRKYSTSSLVEEDSFDSHVGQVYKKFCVCKVLQEH